MARLPDPDARDRWSRLITQQQQSNLTIAEFCQRNAVSTASFYQWRRRIRDQAEPACHFLAVEVTEPQVAKRDVTVRFPCGTQIELDAEDSQNVRWIVDRLASRTAGTQR